MKCSCFCIPVILMKADEIRYPVTAAAVVDPEDDEVGLLYSHSNHAVFRKSR